MFVYYLHYSRVEFSLVCRILICVVGFWLFRETKRNHAKLMYTEYLKVVKKKTGKKKSKEKKGEIKKKKNNQNKLKKKPSCFLPFSKLP